jgi:hypothetical protein
VQSAQKIPIISTEGMAKIRRMVVLMRLLFEDDPRITIDAVYQVVEAAYRSVDGEYGAEQARQSGMLDNGSPFSLAAVVGDGDLAQFQACDLDLARMTREEHNLSLKGRLSEERVRHCVPETDPDFERILRLAKQGVNILRDPSFVAENPVPALRTLYELVAPAVDRMIYKEWKQRKCFILPTEVAKAIIGRWYASLHWTKKKGSIPGRKLRDDSAADPSTGYSLNGGTAKPLAQEQNGKITHPTISKIVNMILDQADKHGWDHISLFQTDIKDAFGQLIVNEEDVCLLLSALTEDLTVIHHRGFFGHTGMPSAFAVVSRVLERRVNAIISGAGLVFADDTMGVSHISKVQEDLALVNEFCVALMGDGAVALEKSISGRVLDFIGWRVNLNSRLITLNERNFHKLLYGFWSVDIHASLSVLTSRQLSGRAARYQVILRPLKMLTSILFASHGEFSHRNKYVSLKPEAKMAITIWRISIVMLGLHEEKFARTLESFRPQAPTVTIMFDSSLTGSGILLTDDTSAGFMGGGRADFPFHLNGDSSHQNTCEFIAIVLGVVSIARTGRSGVSLRLIGDSVSALKWSHAESWKGHLCRRAAVIFLLFGVAFDIHVEEDEHVAGKINTICDDLSRGVSPEEVGVPSHRVIDLEGHAITARLIELCDPRITLNSEQDFVELWREVQGCIRGIKDELVTGILPVWSDSGVPSPLPFPLSLAMNIH